MAMMAPLFKSGVLGEAGFIVSALIVGLLFGFFLERGGLANAKKLTAQFYLTDWTVLKAMFTAIVVAALGLYGLALVGWLNLDEVYLNPSRLWPMSVGGVLVGIGFAVGGYCPGTSLVAVVTGKLDALAFVGGLFVGIGVFSISYRWLAGFTRAGDLGPGMTLDAWLGVSPAVIVFGIVLLAVFAFWGGSKLEARFGGTSS
jgi:uncharacterized protein